MSKKRRAAAPTQRQLRAGELFRHALVEILAREELRDPDLKGVRVTVSEVRCTPDLRQAAVFVAPLGGGDAAKTAAALNRAAGFLRGKLGPHVETKFTPELKFEPDASFDEASKIAALLRKPEVARDLAPAPAATEDDGEPSA